MHSSTVRRRLTRTASVLATTALAVGAISAFAAPAQAAETQVDDASFTWGLNGYAQRGIFGPWTFKDLTGNVAQLSGATQTEYITPAFPATSFPANATSGPNANAVKFTEGEGWVDPDNGSAYLVWSGSYTVNAYPAVYNAPNEIYSNPELSVAPDGSGELTFEFSIGAGTSMSGEPFDAVSFGRLPLATFSAGSISGLDGDSFRLTPDFAGVTLDPTVISNQITTCTSPSLAGSWPTEFVETLQGHPAGQSVVAHFYSTGCGGMQDAKPGLPVDVGYTVAQSATPSVTVSKTAGVDRGETVTVTGTGFLPSAPATHGVRPPLAGQFGGAYVVFGKFAENWKPSAGVASSARTVIGASAGGQKWALQQAQLATAGNQGVLINPDGTFTAELTLTPTEATDLASGNYGVYTYPGSGAVYAPFETYTPITFTNPSEVIVEVPEWVDQPSGSFGWAFEGTSPANLGTATQSGANFVANGSLTNIVVTDTRAGGTTPYSWTVSGQASAFSSSTGASFEGGLLGWTPKIVAGGASVAKGADVTSTQLGGLGLGASRVLASSTAATTATIGADLSLVIPGTTPAGDYRSKLTVTALQ